MKKMLAVIGLCALVANSAYAQWKKNIYNINQQDTAAQKQIAYQVDRAVLDKMLNSSVGSIEQNKTIEFRVREVIEYSFAGTQEKEYLSHRYDLGCKAYALHPNWLILSGRCAAPMGVSDKEADMWLTSNKQEVVEHELFPYGSDQKGMKIEYNNNVMLLWQKKAEYTAPFVKVLAMSSKDKLFSLWNARGSLQINTARLGLNAVRERDFLEESMQGSGNLFLLDESFYDLSGTASDPAFLSIESGDEYLIGYNNGLMDYKTCADGARVWCGKKSDTWYRLTKADLEFIKQTVLENRPQDWAEIQPRLFYDSVDESFK
ncbi:MAG: hypothetical protein J6V32_01410 [Elusimicrobiaceae bacterium]|nr:hypothetical protein [Elusimicrobiaceae bacterium]